jgi:hypothetical protein
VCLKGKNILSYLFLNPNLMGLLKKSFVDLGETLVDFVVKYKSLNHKGSQSTTQSNSKVKSLKKALSKQPL